MAKKEERARFEVIQEEGNSFTVKRRIFLDTVTGVQYLYISEGYSGGLCPLLGPDGKPMTWNV